MRGLNDYQGARTWKDSVGKPAAVNLSDDRSENLLGECQLGVTSLVGGRLWGGDSH